MVFPSSARNEKNLRIIGELATIHGIDEITMRKLVSQSMDLKTNTLNVEQLKKKVRSCKSEFHAEENKSSYSSSTGSAFCRTAACVEVRPQRQVSD